jgi:phage gpG-like protein
MKTLATLIKRRIKERIRKGLVYTEKSKRRGTTLVKSGKLLRSIDAKVIDAKTILVTAGGPGVPYARIHHEGGIIRPRNSQYLTIPLCAKAAAGRARDFENTFIAKGVIFQSNGEGKKPTALYLLRKQVTIPARPYMYISEDDREAIGIQLRQWVAEQLKKAVAK